ncbi:hypothetical protein ACET3Z_000139 [Daucus carota]
MEAFSLLKYWRGGGAASACATPSPPDVTTTISNTLVSNVHESEDEENGDDGPFFDMEFAVKRDERDKEFICESDDDESDDCECEDEDENDNGELKFTLSSASSGESIDPNISLSPSDDLFFKGRLVPLTETDTEADENTNTHSRPVSKTTKLRVLMLKLKKSTKLNATKAEDNDENGENCVDAKKDDKIKQPARFFTVKFKVDEVPVLSLFTRENSSKVSIKQNKEENKESTGKSKTIIEEEEKVFSKDVVNKYLKKVKPLYVRVSKRYGEKLGFSGHLSLAGAAGTPKASDLSAAEATQRSNVKSLKLGIGFPEKLRVVRKQLGKSKSASAAVTAAESPPVVVAKRRDDSLLQQQDGIQSAILHCKRSFKASRELEGKGGNVGNESVKTAELSCSVEKAKGDMQ